MKKLLLILLVFASINLHGQSICVSADCKDTVRYPQDTVTLNGIVTSTDGVKSIKWTVAIGSGVTIDNSNVAVTVARKLSASGLYVFVLTGTSNKNAVGTARDTVVYVGNKPPQAVTGPTVNTSQTTAVLSGSGSFDAEGLPITYLWAQLSGPNAAVINTATMSNPLVSGLVGGTYVFRLTVTDKGGLTSTATQSVVMAPTIVKTVTTVTTYYSDGTTKTVTTTVP